MRPIAAALLLVLAGCGGGRSDARGPVSTVAAVQPRGSAATRPTTSAPTSDPSLVAPEGFGRVQARVTAANGAVCDLCAWLADSPDLRARGLMQVTDFGPADAMAFVYPSPTTSWFWMKDTVLPLSIAFFDASGMFLDSFDMDPCITVLCPSHPTPPDFMFAIETPQGSLGELLIGAGSTLTLFDLPCE